MTGIAGHRATPKAFSKGLSIAGIGYIFDDSNPEQHTRCEIADEMR